jgi:hypothetical protein
MTHYTNANHVQQNANKASLSRHEKASTEIIFCNTLDEAINYLTSVGQFNNEHFLTLKQTEILRTPNFTLLIDSLGLLND